MSGVVTVSRGTTSRPWTSASDPSVSSDSTIGVRVGDTWINTATQNMFTCTSNAAGAAAWRFQPRILGASAVTGMSITGTVAETVLATVPLAAGVIGANGILRVTSLWQVTNSVNNKILTWRIGASGNGIGGSIYGQTTQTTVASMRMQQQLQNRNSVSAQVLQSGIGTGGWGTTTAGISTDTRDTSVALDLVFTGTLANTGETITLQSYTVELLRP